MISKIGEFNSLIHYTQKQKYSKTRKQKFITPPYFLLNIVPNVNSKKKGEIKLTVFMDMEGSSPRRHESFKRLYSQIITIPAS